MLPADSLPPARALGGAGLPDRIDVVVLGEHLGERVASAGDDIDDAAGTSDVSSTE